MSDPRPIVRRAPYHDTEGRLALPIDVAQTAALLPLPATSAVLAAVAHAAAPTELVKLVVAEPALADLVFAVGASPLLGAGRDLGDVGGVICQLGAPAIRDAALLWTVRCVVGRAEDARFGLAAVLEDATRRACVAFVAAQDAGYESPREAFTAGLLQDFGVIVMGLLCPERAGQLDLCQARPIGERVLWERAIFGGAHTEIMAPYAAAWHLPPGVAHAISAHHDEVIALADRRAQRLSELLRLADAVTDLCQVGATEPNLARARTKLAALKSRRPLTLATIMDRAADVAPALATAVGLPVPARCTLEQLLSTPTRTPLRAVRGLGERGAFTRGDRTLRTEQLHREKERLARELRAGRSHIALLSRFDAATGVSSRRELCQLLGALITQAKGHSGPLSVVLVELEDAVSESGDPRGAGATALLREAAARIRDALRAEDVLGRIGSDVPAFGVLLPGCDAASGPSVVGRLRDRLQATTVTVDGREVRLRALFGGTTVTPGAAQTIEDVVAACERAVELARRDGGEIGWCSVGDEPAAALG